MTWLSYLEMEGMVVEYVFTYFKETLGPFPAVFVAMKLGAFHKTLGLLQRCLWVPQQVF